MTKLSSLVLLALLFPLPVFAQQGDPVLERVLIPIIARDVAGANGSVWSAIPYVHNDSSRTAGMTQCYDPRGISDHILNVEPGATAEVDLTTPTLFYFLAEQSEHIWFSLRLRERTRGAQPDGVTIPVVRERELWGRHLVLVDVPIHKSGTRQTLRIYDAHGTRPVVLATLRDLATNQVVATSEMQTSGGGEVGPCTPSYAEISDLGKFAGTYEGRANIAVDVIKETVGYPKTAGLWAMVSITDNATQSVTLVTPH
jgi:hypothetical protein